MESWARSCPKVAKLPKPDAEDGGASAGMERELAMLVRAQGHPNVLRLHGLFSLGGSWAIVSEYCSHGDLGSIVQRQPFVEADARPIFQGILQGLAHVHGRGIVHDDVKAENVLLRADRQALLADFGISRLASEEGTSCQGVRGTPGYVAPEVVAGKGSSELSDVFSAGASFGLRVWGSEMGGFWGICASEGCCNPLGGQLVWRRIAQARVEQLLCCNPSCPLRIPGSIPEPRTDRVGPATTACIGPESAPRRPQDGPRPTR